MSNAEIRPPAHRGVPGKRAEIRPAQAMTWEKTLMKMPTEQSTELRPPEAGPYSRVMMASSVMQPLCRSLWL